MVNEIINYGHGWRAFSHHQAMATLQSTAPLPPATENERSKAMVAGIARWLVTLQPGRAERRRLFESFPADDGLGISQGLRSELWEMLGIVGSERAQTPRITAAVDALAGPVIMGQTVAFTATAVCWPAFTVGGAVVHGEGLWLRQRTGTTPARVIVLPDADHSPELVSGCLMGSSPQDHYALRLGKNRSDPHHAEFRIPRPGLGQGCIWF